jgi:hypothetical protein
MTSHPAHLLALSMALVAFAGCHASERPAEEPAATYDRNAEGAEAEPTVAVAEPEATPAAQGRFCGGIAAFPCPGSGVCVDAPDDACDPARGGADCGGICRCEADVLCAPGTRFDPSPDVCDCVAAESPNDDICARVRCMGGTRCVADGTSARCVPIND